MKAPRSVIQGAVSADGSAPPREFLSVAVRITAATGTKDGFFVQLFPDLRAPQTIYLTIAQLERLLSLAEAGATEGEIWAELAKVPLEPLQPARSLYPRLRSLLIDCLVPLREEIRTQQRRAEARARAAEAAAAPEPAPAETSPVAPAPVAGLRDPDAL